MRSWIAPVSGLKPAAIRFVLASLVAASLVGCRTTDDGSAGHVAGWTLVDASQRHPIIVSQQPATLSIRVPSGSQGLSPAQAALISERGSSA